MPADEPRGTSEQGWEVHEANADALRGAMRLFPTGVTVVTSGQEERAEGMTANAVVSVSLDPLLFLVSVHQEARLNPRIREEGYFAVNILAADQEGLSRLFASPERSSGLPAIRSLGGGYGSTGAPLAAGGLGVFGQHLLPHVRPRPSDSAGLVYAGGIDADGAIVSGKVRSPASGETYEVKNGYLDLLGNRVGADNAANLGNYLPGAGRAYEPLWRVHSLTLLTGEPFSMERELGIISELVGAERGGLYLDLGCSAGLYTRGLARELGDRGDVVGIDISPSMLREAARRARNIGARPSFVRTD